MEKVLTVVEQKEVLFYEDKVLAVRIKDGTVYVPVRPICEQLGISWPSQSNRIKRDAVLSDGLQRRLVLFRSLSHRRGWRAM